MKRECPIGSEINVHVSEVGWKAAYLGMKNVARMHSDLIPKMSFSRHEYVDKQKVEFMNFA